MAGYPKGNRPFLVQPLTEVPDLRLRRSLGSRSLRPWSFRPWPFGSTFAAWALRASLARLAEFFKNDAHLDGDEFNDAACFTKIDCHAVGILGDDSELNGLAAHLVSDRDLAAVGRLCDSDVTCDIVVLVFDDHDAYGFAFAQIRRFSVPNCQLAVLIYAGVAFQGLNGFLGDLRTFIASFLEDLENGLHLGRGELHGADIFPQIECYVLAVLVRDDELESFAALLIGDSRFAVFVGFSCADIAPVFVVGIFDDDDTYGFAFTQVR